MSAPDPARAPASEPAAAEAPPALPPLIVRHLDHLRIQRRLAERTLAMYGDAFRRLDVFCANEGLDLTAVRPHHVRGWTARLHAQGLGPRSIAITLAGWRGLYKWLGREGLVRLNPVEGIKPPKAPKPLPKALGVDDAVRLAEFDNTGADPWLEARDAAMVELLYGCGLRVGELVGLDAVASPQAQREGRGWVDNQTLGQARRASAFEGGPPLPVAVPAMTMLGSHPGSPSSISSSRATSLMRSMIRCATSALKLTTPRQTSPSHRARPRRRARRRPGCAG